MKAIVTTSWDDGSPYDLKLAEILTEHNIPATFYIPIENSERDVMTSNQIRQISQYYDIGGHTYHHSYLPQMYDNEAFKEILNGREQLREITGLSIDSFCYPRGGYDKTILQLVEKAGFKSARTTEGLRINPYHNCFKLGVTAKLVRKGKPQFLGCLRKPSNNNIDIKFQLSMLKRGVYLKDGWGLAIDAVKYVMQNGGVCHIWEHSWKIEQYDEWHNLREFLKFLDEAHKKGHIMLVDNTQLMNYLGNLRISPSI